MFDRDPITPDNFLTGLVRVRVVSQVDCSPLRGVGILIADSHEAVLGQR
ncbi:MAG: hypothetical protein U0798_03035 [Gemmataceae bacterium]